MLKGLICLYTLTQHYQAKCLIVWECIFAYTFNALDGIISSADNASVTLGNSLANLKFNYFKTFYKRYKWKILLFTMLNFVIFRYKNTKIINRKNFKRKNYAHSSSKTISLLSLIFVTSIRILENKQNSKNMIPNVLKTIELSLQ